MSQHKQQCDVMFSRQTFLHFADGTSSSDLPIGVLQKAGGSAAASKSTETHKQQQAERELGVFPELPSTQLYRCVNRGKKH